MLSVDFYLKGKKVNYPQNLDDLRVSISFEDDSPDIRISLNSWDFLFEEATLINDHVTDGLTGGVGITEGIPLGIKLSDGNTNVTFNYYLDTVNEAVYACDKVSISSKETGKIDWLNDNANFTFQYLHEVTGHITDSRFVPVPYVLSSIPNYRDAFIGLITTTFVLKEFLAATAKIGEHIIVLWNPFAVDEPFKAIVFLIYFIGVSITLIKLITDFIKLIIQLVKYHTGMFVKEQLEAGCDYLGVGFSSSIFNTFPWNKLFIVPQKFNNPPDGKDKRILGFITPNKSEQPGYFKGTFADLLGIMKDKFNAKVVIKNNTLHFERNDKATGSGVFTLPDLRSDDKYQTNASEIKSTYNITFATDLNNRNSIDEYEGTAISIITTPKVVVNRDMVLIKGFQDVRIPLVRAKRKESLTIPEEVIKSFLETFDPIFKAYVKIANALIDAFNAIKDLIDKIKKILKLAGFKIKPSKTKTPKISKVNPGKLIENRIGMWKLENDIVSEPHVMILNESSDPRATKIHPDNDTLLSAEKLWDDFHSINSFVPSNALPNANQWKRRKAENFTFTFDDFNLIASDALIKTASGKDAKIESLEWNVKNQTATISYAVNELYTNNLQQTKLIPNGR